MKHRREFLKTALAGSLVLVAGCAGSEPDPTDGGSSLVEETSSVTMTDSQFEPRNIHVEAGTTVTWSNESSVDHTVTAATENWDHDVVVPSGEEATFAFSEDGVYDVFCSYHGSQDLTGMSMKVGVGEATIEDPVTDSSDDGGLY